MGFCQIQYNYVDTDVQAGDRGYALAEQLGIPMVIMEPIKGGSLSYLPEDIAAEMKAYAQKKHFFLGIALGCQQTKCEGCLKWHV